MCIAYEVLHNIFKTFFCRNFKSATSIMESKDFVESNLLEWWVDLGKAVEWQSSSSPWPWDWQIINKEGFGRYLSLSYQLPVKTSIQFVNIEIHIVFHTVYQVPVLYFNIYRPNGTRLTPLEGQDFLSFFPETDFGSFLTQTEHIFTQKPFLMIHPCKTHDFMQQFETGSGEGRAFKYLLTWFNVYGAFLNLHLCPVFFQAALNSVQR